MVFGIADDNLGPFHVANLIAPVPSGVINRAEYAPAALAATSFGGVQYGVPIDLETLALFYNKKLVPSPPKTFAQVFSDAKQLDAKGDYGFEYGVNNRYDSAGFIAGFGGYIFKSSHGALDTKDIGFDTPGGVKGLEFVHSFVKDGFMPADIKTEIAVAHFEAGKLGMIVDGPWDVPTYEHAGVHFGVEPLPLLPNGAHPLPFYGTQTGFVSRTVSANEQRLSWSLMKYLMKTSPGPLLRTGNRIPALETAQAAARKSDPHLAAFFAASKYTQPLPDIAAMSAVWTPAADNLVLMNQGKESASAAAKNIVKQVQAGIAEFK